eukprot:6121527-Lingulodinium_polyedra.AAC.1
MPAKRKLPICVFATKFWISSNASTSSCPFFSTSSQADLMSCTRSSTGLYCSRNLSVRFVSPLRFLATEG